MKLQLLKTGTWAMMAATAEPLPDAVAVIDIDKTELRKLVTKAEGNKGGKAKFGPARARTLLPKLTFKFEIPAHYERSYAAWNSAIGDYNYEWAEREAAIIEVSARTETWARKMTRPKIGHAVFSRKESTPEAIITEYALKLIS